LSRIIQALDTAALLFIREHIVCPALNPAMYLLSVLGSFGALWLIISAIFYASGDRRSSVFIVLSLVISLIVTNLILKNAVARPRPFELIEGFAPLMGRFADAGGFSFPSGHSSSSFAAAFALAASKGKKGALAYIPAALISFSRLYVGVHFPSDVLFGAAVGTLCGAAAAIIMKKIIRKL
jgi:undecaprenyl-diphosphatase